MIKRLCECTVMDLGTHVHGVASPAILLYRNTRLSPLLYQFFFPLAIAGFMIHFLSQSLYPLHCSKYPSYQFVSDSRRGEAEWQNQSGDTVLPCFHHHGHALLSSSRPFLFTTAAPPHPWPCSPTIPPASVPVSQHAPSHHTPHSRVPTLISAPRA